MPSTPDHHRCPRAGLDPIDDRDAALAVVALAAHRPVRDETIVIVLDDARRGVAVVVVSGTTEPDAVLDVVEFVAASADATTGHDGRIAAIVVASIRPSGAAPTSPSERTDTDRWCELSEMADASGLELVEWFVIDDRVTCPRDRLGEPPRWGRP